MPIGLIVTRGYGVNASIPAIVARGFQSAQTTPPTPQPTPSIGARGGGGGGAAVNRKAIDAAVDSAIQAIERGADGPKVTKAQVKVATQKARRGLYRALYTREIAGYWTDRDLVIEAISQIMREIEALKLEMALELRDEEDFLRLLT